MYLYMSIKAQIKKEEKICLKFSMIDYGATLSEW